MRKSYALLVLVPFGILAACEDSEDGGLNLNLDGGQPVLDGAVTPPPPPPPADAADAGPLPVTVTVTNASGPEANVPVVFHDATGAVLATVSTSATGVAAQVVPAGSQVTVVMGTTAAPQLLTITEVEPGDVLTAFEVPPAEGLSVTLASVPSGAPANVNLRPIAGDCQGNYGPTPPLGLYVNERCQFAGKFPLLVSAYDGETGDEMGFTFKKTNAIVATDGGVPIDIDVTEPWSTTLRTHTIAVSNVPASKNVNTTFSEVAGGVARPSQSGFYNEGSETMSFQREHIGHPGYPDFVQSEIEHHQYNDGEMSVSAIATREASPAGPATTSFNYADFLPYIDGTTLDETTTERPSVTWKVEEGKSLDTADGAYVLVRWNTYEGQTPKQGVWTFVAPANRTTVKAPVLPANLTAFGPPTADAGVDFGFVSPTIVTVVEAAAINGYVDFRKISASLPAAGAVQWSNGSDTFIPPLPAAGTLRATGYTRSSD